MKKIYKILVKLALKLRNFSYKVVSTLAIKAEGGLHPKHRLIGYHKFFLDNISLNDYVLDIGCGNGALAFDVSKKAKKIVGIDILPSKIKEAKKKYSASNLDYIIGDATKDLKNEKYDVVILSNVLEHIEDRISFLKKIKDISPKFLIRVPMFDRDWETPYKKELGLEWRLDSTHFTEYALKSFQDEMDEANYKIKKYSVQWGEIWAVVS